ncbi:hypothetical protein CBL_03574 [Carabus blaptoides fortunei]
MFLNNTRNGARCCGPLVCFPKVLYLSHTHTKLCWQMERRRVAKNMPSNPLTSIPSVTRTNRHEPHTEAIEWLNTPARSPSTQSVSLAQLRLLKLAKVVEHESTINTSAHYGYCNNIQADDN